MSKARIFWITVGSLYAIGALSMGLVQMVGMIAHEEYDETAVYPVGAITAVDVGNGEGHVKVVGSDRTDILVVGHIDDGLRKPSRSASVDGDRLVLDAHCHWMVGTFCRVDYEIEVPRSMLVHAESDNGNVDVRHIDNDVSVNTNNGNLRIRDVSGALTLNTENGSITGSELSSVKAKTSTNNGNTDLTFNVAVSEVRASSHNGNVHVSLPDTPDEYRVETKTHNGSRDSQVRTDPTSSRLVSISTSNGDVDVTYTTP